MARRWTGERAGLRARSDGGSENQRFDRGKTENNECPRARDPRHRGTTRRGGPPSAGFRCVWNGRSCTQHYTPRVRSPKWSGRPGSLRANICEFRTRVTGLATDTSKTRTRSGRSPPLGRGNPTQKRRQNREGRTRRVPNSDFDPYSGTHVHGATPVFNHVSFVSDHMFLNLFHPSLNFKIDDILEPHKIF